MAFPSFSLFYNKSLKKLRKAAGKFKTGSAADRKKVFQVG
ncbi:hypothetical protein STRDD11_01043 [Streptococcus sp. DD11]|nr:hypothetical protein STRDD11_01043 [Streptococcus sp. DD11]